MVVIAIAEDARMNESWVDSQVPKVDETQDLLQNTLQKETTGICPQVTSAGDSSWPLSP